MQWDQKMRASSTVYGLARASSLKQGDSPAVQGDRIRSACMALGLGDPTILEEPLGTSGRSTPFAEREKGGWLLQNARKGDTIVATKLDRLGRRTVDTLQTIEQFHKRGVRIIVLNVQGSILDMASPYAKFAISILAAAAELEGDMIAERTSEAMEWMGAQGYRISHSHGLGKKLVPIPGVCTKKGDGHQKYRTAWDQAQLRIIREIIQRRDEYRQSWEAIAVAFLRLGYRDELGIPWGGVPENGGRPLKHSKDRPRTKKIRRAYKWWKQAAAEGKLPLIG
jgi:DNA invertase Pin-like site-specific DNA recombinase